MLYLLSNSGEYLFSGTKRELKQFIRKNKLSNYNIRSSFPGEVPTQPVQIQETVKPTLILDKETPEGAFNAIFENE
jgi:hypothetical protein